MICCCSSTLVMVARNSVWLNIWLSEFPEPLFGPMCNSTKPTKDIQPCRSLARLPGTRMYLLRPSLIAILTCSLFRFPTVNKDFPLALYDLRDTQFSTVSRAGPSVPTVTFVIVYCTASVLCYRVRLFNALIVSKQLNK